MSIDLILHEVNSEMYYQDFYLYFCIWAFATRRCPIMYIRQAAGSKHHPFVGRPYPQTHMLYGWQKTIYSLANLSNINNRIFATAQDIYSIESALYVKQNKCGKQL